MFIIGILLCACNELLKCVKYYKKKYIDALENQINNYNKFQKEIQTLKYKLNEQNNIKN